MSICLYITRDFVQYLGNAKKYFINDQIKKEMFTFTEGARSDDYWYRLQFLSDKFYSHIYFEVFKVVIDRCCFTLYIYLDNRYFPRANFHTRNFNNFPISDDRRARMLCCVNIFIYQDNMYINC